MRIKGEPGEVRPSLGCKALHHAGAAPKATLNRSTAPHTLTMTSAGWKTTVPALNPCPRKGARVSAVSSYNRTAARTTVAGHHLAAQMLSRTSAPLGNPNVPNVIHLPSTRIGVVAPHVAHHAVGVAASYNPDAATDSHACCESPRRERALAYLAHCASAQLAFEEVCQVIIPAKRSSLSGTAWLHVVLPSGRYAAMQRYNSWLGTLH